MAFDKDLADGVHNAAWQRLIYKYSLQQFYDVARNLLGLPERDVQRDGAGNETEVFPAQEWVNARLKEVGDYLATLKPDDNITADAAGGVETLPGRFSRAGAGYRGEGVPAGARPGRTADDDGPAQDGGTEPYDDGMGAPGGSLYEPAASGGGADCGRSQSAFSAARRGAGGAGGVRRNSHERCGAGCERAGGADEHGAALAGPGPDYGDRCGADADGQRAAVRCCPLPSPSPRCGRPSPARERKRGRDAGEVETAPLPVGGTTQEERDAARSSGSPASGVPDKGVGQ